MKKNKGDDFFVIQIKTENKEKIDNVYYISMINEVSNNKIKNNK